MFISSVIKNISRNSFFMSFEYTILGYYLGSYLYLKDPIPKIFLYTIAGYMIYVLLQKSRTYSSFQAVNYELWNLTFELFYVMGRGSLLWKIGKWKTGHIFDGISWFLIFFLQGLSVKLRLWCYCQVRVVTVKCQNCVHSGGDWDGPSASVACPCIKKSYNNIKILGNA